MKTEIRIPTTQYGYITLEFEGTAEEAIAEHNRVLSLYAGGAGLPDKEYNAFIDRQLMGEPNEMEVYASMSLEQQSHVQIIKRALNRIKYKQEKQ